MNSKKEAIGEGIVSGVITGIGIKTGQSIDPESLLILIVKRVCKATENGAGYFDCGPFIGLMIFISILITIDSVLRASKNVKGGFSIGKYDIKGTKFGIFLYLLGWIGGNLLILLA